MTAKQKAVKYLALAFAVFLIVSFALGIFELMTSLLGVEVTKPVGTKYLYDHGISDTVTVLEVNVSAADVKFTEGAEFKVYTDNENISCTENGNTVNVSDNKKFNVVPDGEVVIEIPSDKVFDKVKLTTGAGEITLKYLDTNNLYLSLGAGDVYFSELFVRNRADISCAAGEFSVKSGEITNLNMDMAVGDASLECSLFGNTEIDCGVGDISIKLPESISFYRFEVDKGICSASLNGKDMEDEKVYGTGENFIEIDGAVGDVSIKTNE